MKYVVSLFLGVSYWLFLFVVGDVEDVGRSVVWELIVFLFSMWK